MIFVVLKKMHRNGQKMNIKNIYVRRLKEEDNLPRIRCEFISKNDYILFNMF